MKNIKWGQIVPLIGGLCVANKKITGNDPAFLISYSPFAGNEENVKARFPNVPHHELDKLDNGGFDIAANQDVDFVSAVCPCAGLSMLSNGSPEQRSSMNKWMLRSADFVTSHIKPKVFWGENAPALYSTRGEIVRNQLKDIATKNGYSFSVYLTNTALHGIPQLRKRSFYFFWKNSNVPTFEYYERPKVMLADYLKQLKVGTLHHTAEDIKEATDHLLNYPYIKFLQEKYNGKGLDTIRKYLVDNDKRSTTLLAYFIKTDQLTELRDWLALHDIREFKSAHREAARILDLVNAGRGFWDGSFQFYRGDMEFSTLMSRTIYAVHPTEDRCITTRERLHLMGLPDDFELVTGQQNHICQNVPVNTGADMTSEVIAYLNGEREISTSTFMLQNNITKRIDFKNNTLLGY
jgi:site-specific DNA-cytosine methylase